LLAEPLDAAILLEGFRSAERLFTSEAFSKHILGLVGPTPSPNGSLSDDEFMQLLKTNAFHFAHGVGSCKMAPDGDPSGVVDTEFKVRDAKGLRVVDASVMVRFPSLCWRTLTLCQSSPLFLVGIPK
jgi:choline dehydrogenase